MPYEPHPSAGALPPDDTVIWRFMSLAKFLSLLAKSSIFFCQALRLRSDDPYEGTLSRPNLMFYQLMENPVFARQYFKMAPDEALPFNYLDVFSPDRQKQLGDIFAARLTSTAGISANMNLPFYGRCTPLHPMGLEYVRLSPD
jgi:hypothetical protein